ncbi:MAG: phosphate ABC transporter permease PstA, partial [Candidatus Dormibacteraceae bacterium]
LPLALVLLYVLINGLPALALPSFLTNPEHPTGIPGGGVANALLGTVIMVGLASLLALPVGVIAGSKLAAWGRGRLADLIRLCTDALVAAPSIAIGLFVYALLVAPSHAFSGGAGAVALALLMLPLIVRTTETAVAQVEGELRQAGLALGLPGWQVSLRLVLPAALPGVLTGAMLAIARAAGESAPLLFTSLGNRLLNFDPGQPMSALPLVVYHDALTPYPDLQQTAWGAALVLILFVLAVNLLTRLLMRHR